MVVTSVVPAYYRLLPIFTPDFTKSQLQNLLSPVLVSHTDTCKPDKDVPFVSPSAILLLISIDGATN